MKPKKKAAPAPVLSIAAPHPPEGKTIIEEIAAKTGAFSLGEFSRLTGISYKTAFALQRDGRLPVLRIGSAIRCDPHEIAEWLRKNRRAIA